jgi:hypothetical protein
MSERLTQPELAHLETFVTTCLSDPGSMSHGELLEAIHDNHELCAKALRQLQRQNIPAAARPLGSSEGVTEEDLRFLESWLKARNLVIGGLQLLQLADPDNAASIQHEVDCTETAFKLLPGLISKAKHQMQSRS